MLGSKIVTFGPKVGVPECGGEAAAAFPVGAVTVVITRLSARARPMSLRLGRSLAGPRLLCVWGVMRFVLSAERQRSVDRVGWGGTQQAGSTGATSAGCESALSICTAYFKT